MNTTTTHNNQIKVMMESFNHDHNPSDAHCTFIENGNVLMTWSIHLGH